MSDRRTYGWLWAAVIFSGVGFAAGWWIRDQPVGGLKADRASEISTGSKQESALGSAFESWSRSSDFAGAMLGFCVLDETGAVVYESPLAETAMCPASALKTVTTGAAFDLLGPEFRFETKLAAGSAIAADGSVSGDLTLIGGGDPTLTEEDLEKIAADAVKLGLKKVEGSLKIDAAVFNESPVSDHWNWGDIGNAYGVGAYGVNVGHNRLLLVFDPGTKVGDAAKLRGTLQELSAVRFDSMVTTGSADSGDGTMIYSSPGGDRIQMSGTVPLGKKGFTVRGAVPNPPALAQSLLREFLTQQGVVFSNRNVLTDSSSVLVTHTSAPLPLIVDHLHEVSDNLEAQCLFLMMGKLQNAPATEVLKRYWESAGISFQGLRLIDGSGLARATMIRPIDLAKVNHAARHAANGDRFLQSLSKELNGKVSSKRGAMSGVRTEVGFVNHEGREFTFALMANGLPATIDFWKLRASLLEMIGE